MVSEYRPSFIGVFVMSLLINMHSVINIRFSLLFCFGILQLPSPAKNDENGLEAK